MQIDSTKGRVLELIESTLQLSNLDLALAYLFKPENSAVSLTSRVQNDIVSPALVDTQVRKKLSFGKIGRLCSLHEHKLAFFGF